VLHVSKLLKPADEVGVIRKKSKWMPLSLHCQRFTVMEAVINVAVPTSQIGLKNCTEITWVNNAIWKLFTLDSKIQSDD
jgi:hypothetical protein